MKASLSERKSIRIYGENAKPRKPFEHKNHAWHELSSNSGRKMGHGMGTGG